MASMLRQIPRNARLAFEFLVGVGVVVVALSADHTLIAVALGSAALLVLLLELFWEAAWNGVAAAVVRSAAQQGLFQPPDPGARERVRELRAALLHLLTELGEIQDWINNAINSGEYWIGRPDVLHGPVWHNQRWFISSERGFESLYETLDAAYRAVALAAASAHAAQNRARLVDHGFPVHEEDLLPARVRPIADARQALREHIATLSSGGE